MTYNSVQEFVTLYGKKYVCLVGLNIGTWAGKKPQPIRSNVSHQNISRAETELLGPQYKIFQPVYKIYL